jgi:glutamyl-tRNA reductase
MHRRRNRPMFFIDLAVPRDVDPAMGNLEGIFVYDIDDLQAVAAAHLAERSREATDAEALIAAEVDRFHQRRLTFNAAPAIVALQRQAEELRQAELHKAHARLSGLNAEQIAAVEALTRGLVNKFLHPPMQALKLAARQSDTARIDAICHTWSLPTGAERNAAGLELAETKQEAAQSGTQPKDSANEKTEEERVMEIGRRAGKQ